MAEWSGSGTILLMEIIENRSYFESLEDAVGKLIQKIDPSDRQAVYRKAKNDLRRAFVRRKCQFFLFRKGRMGLEGSNDSVLIKVGPKKRGHLAAYKGEWVRVCWFSTYGFSMECAVQVVKVPESVEAKLIPAGDLSTQEFTEDVAARYPKDRVSVNGEPLIRSIKGTWVSATPTDAALQNLEKDEIPDGVGYYKTIRQPGSAYLLRKHYHKFAGLWIKTHASREELTSGKLDWIPVGGRVHVERSGDILSGWSVRTSDGWKDEAQS